MKTWVNGFKYIEIQGTKYKTQNIYLSLYQSQEYVGLPLTMKFFFNESKIFLRSKIIRLTFEG